MRVNGLSPVWRKSTHSAGNGDCVEAARLGDVIGLRDSKSPERGQLNVPAGAFEAFLRRVRRDET
jgi:hypothetical protein